MGKEYTLGLMERYTMESGEMVLRKETAFGEESLVNHI
jgi:hypothetical protein